MTIHLLLAHADDHRPALADGLAGASVERTPAPDRLAQPRELRNRGRDPNDLAEQRWGLIVPAGDAGARLEALVRPLVERRRDEQGAEVRVYRVPADLDAAGAARWHREVYLDEALPESELPFYQLIVGDLDQVPLAVQQVQMIDGVVGRLACADERGYEAYVAKLLAWERTPAPVPRARSLFYTVHDGSGATTVGYEALVAPGLAIARADRERGSYPAADVVELGAAGQAPSPDELVAAVAAAEPAVLFSVSHGEGAPRAGWASLDEQRRRQGAMSLGAGALTADDVAARRFLPGGVWFMLACFGAGTPDTSAYRPWLERLRQLGEYGGRVDAVLRSLPAAGERPFIAALPKALLANPDGPIAFVGHVDLAWSYSFQELDGSAGPKNRQRRFTSLLHYALRRDRVGVAFRELVSCALAADTELVGLYARQASGAGDPADPSQLARLGHLWMLRQDLMGYLLLGDPAARLPITPMVAQVRPPSPADFFPFATAPAAPSPPAVPLDKLEEAVLQVLAGERGPKAIAQEVGIDRAELERLAAAYRAAGRAALDRER
jgi:hypothetical protein